MIAAEPPSSQSFPADPPISLDDPTSIISNDWRAFDGLTEMTDHWDRPGWDFHTRRYYWFLTVDHAPAVVRQAQECQQAIRHLELDNVPPDGLHVTVARIADVTEVPARKLTELLAAAERRCRDVAPFTVRAMPLSGSRGAIRFSLAPWRPLWDLHDAVRNACTDVGITKVKPTASFRPHLGVAYCNRSMPAAPVQQAVASIRTLPQVDFPVTDVRLVELRRGRRRYEWKTLSTISLASSRGS